MTKLIPYFTIMLGAKHGVYIGAFCILTHLIVWCVIWALLKTKDLKKKICITISGQSTMVNIATWVPEQTPMDELVLERCSHFVKPSLLCTLTISMAGSGSSRHE